DLGVQSVVEVNSTLDGWEYDTRIIVGKYLDPEGRFLFEIAKIYEETVGYIIARKEYYEKDSAYLPFIAVKKGMQGKGIGSQLLERAIEKAKNLGYKNLILDCEGSNLPFYEKFAKSNHLEHTVENVGHFRFGDTKHFITYRL
ncbi:MAG: hypothetical protein K940chlam7_02090, partial [Chlamydiae bacterium]|nr:hypothetical protein [Chlamydiota bacterium]